MTIIEMPHVNELVKEKFIAEVDFFKKDNADNISAYVLISVNRKGDVSYGWHGKAILLSGALEITKCHLLETITEIEKGKS